MMYCTKWISSTLLIAVLVSCKEDDGPRIRYTVPEDRSDGIEVGSAVDLGYDINLLSQVTQLNMDGTYENIHSILIAKDDVLFFEEYFPGKPIYGPARDWDREDRHNLHSVTKSFNSALIGIAIDQYGLSIDDPIKDFFPELDDANWEGQKEEITVEDLLTMSSGLEWDEWSYSYDDERNDHSAMYASGNWVYFVIQQPLVTTPGTDFVYNSGLSITLGEIVRRVSGKEIGTFAREHLFQPLGVHQFDWQVGPDRQFQTGGGLSLRPRDMLKFGLLFLNEGVWEVEELISAVWTQTSTQQHGPNLQYGYQWWLTNYRVKNKLYDAYFAGGRGGQYIIVIEALDMVVVFTAGNDNALASRQPREMMLDFIVPSVIAP